jgi:hypothetical protein
MLRLGDGKSDDSKRSGDMRLCNALCLCVDAVYGQKSVRYHRVYATSNVSQKGTKNSKAIVETIVFKSIATGNLPVHLKWRVRYNPYTSTFPFRSIFPMNGPWISNRQTGM